MTESRYRALQVRASQSLLNAYSVIEEEGMNEEEMNFFISLIIQKLSNDLAHNLFIFKKEGKND